MLNSEFNLVSGDVHPRSNLAGGIGDWELTKRIHQVWGHWSLRQARVIKYHLADSSDEEFDQISKIRNSCSVHLTGFLIKLHSTRKYMDGLCGGEGSESCKESLLPVLCTCVLSVVFTIIALNLLEL